MKTVNYLDVTLNLENSTYRPYQNKKQSNKIYKHHRVLKCHRSKMSVIYICYHEDNVPSRLSPRSLCGNWCTWAHNVRLHIADTIEPKSARQAKQGDNTSGHKWSTTHRVLKFHRRIQIEQCIERIERIQNKQWHETRLTTSTFSVIIFYAIYRHNVSERRQIR